MKFILYIVFTVGNYSAGDPRRDIAFSGEYDSFKACAAASEGLQKQMGRQPRINVCTGKK